jgi:hypothetical protein
MKSSRRGSTQEEKEEEKYHFNIIQEKENHYTRCHVQGCIQRNICSTC